MTDYQPPRLMRSAHLQAVLASLPARKRPIMRRTATLLAATARTTLEVPDGTRLYADVTPASQPGRTAVLIHGWEGSSGSMYMVSAAARLSAAGFRVVRLNLRDHGDSHHLNRELFHSCRLDEVVAAIRVIQAQAPDDRLYVGGYSLGGNFAMRVAATAPVAGLRIERVAAICPVLDPRETMHALEHGPAIYQFYFIQKWRRSLALKRQAFPGDYDFGDLGRFRSLRDMTEHFVRRYTGYADLESYLAGYAITGECLAGLTIPAEILLAQDDPVIPVAGAARLAPSPALSVRHTRHGGHMGFLTDWRLGSWLDDYLARQFGAV